MRKILKRALNRARPHHGSRLIGARRSTLHRAVAETLENRRLLTVVYNPVFGTEALQSSAPFTVMNHPTVYVIYWGSWGTGAGQTSTATPLAITQAVLSSTFLNVVKQYGSDGTAVYGGSFVDTSTPSANYNPGNVSGASLTAAQTEIQTLINNGTVPGPSSNLPLQNAPIYALIPDPNHTAGTNGGYNTGGTVSTGSPATSKNVNILGIGTDPNFSNFGETFSHEMAEKMSDPTSGGVVVSGGANLPSNSNFIFNTSKPPSDVSNWGQIGDFEQEPGGQFHYSYRIGGPTTSAIVQSTWSNADSAFTVEDGNTQLFELAPNWTGITATNANFSNNYALTINGDQLANKNDTITITPDSAGGVQVNLNGELAWFDPQTSLFQGTALSSIQINGGAGNDTFNITPVPGIPITIDGGSPTPPSSPGDTLLVHSPASSTTLSDTLSASGHAGTVQASGDGKITYSNIESLQPADLSITKAGSAQVTAGSAAGLSYTLTVKNVGIANEFGGFTVSDTLPPGEIYVSSSPGGLVVGQKVTFTNSIGLDVGASQVFTITAKVASSLSYGTILNNIATLSLAPNGETNTNPADNVSNNVSTTVITVADLSITKTSLPAAVEGQNLTYTVTVTNNGPSDANGASVIDNVPSVLTNVSYTAVETGGATNFTASGTGNISDSDNIPAGATVTYYITGTINPAATGTISNTAATSVAAPEIDLNPNNNLATWSTNIVPAALEPDPFGPGTALFIGNGQGGKYIDVSNLPASQLVKVTIGTIRTASYTQYFSSLNLDRIVLYAAGGSDNIRLESSVTVPSMVFASGGHNVVRSSDNANDVLVTSGGNNLIMAGSGNSIVIGGSAGNDTLNGYGANPSNTTSTSQDLFIAGGTSFDTNLTALNALSNEWSRNVSLSTRANDIIAGSPGDLNGPYLFNDATITPAVNRDTIEMTSTYNMVFANVAGPIPHDTIVSFVSPYVYQL